MKIRVIFAWYDLWVGAFWDRNNLRLYILPIPCFGLVFDFAPPVAASPRRENSNAGHRHEGGDVFRCQLSQRVTKTIRTTQDQGVFASNKPQRMRRRWGMASRSGQTVTGGWAMPKKVPTQPGYYWAMWRTAANGTHEGDQLTPSNNWEVVEVWENFIGDSCEADKAEKFGVSVAGVRESQWLENFIWGKGPLEM